MNQLAVVSKFSHVKPEDTEFREGGLRDFFLYRDLGIADATGGQVICHLVKANPALPPEEGTGWHSLTAAAPRRRVWRSRCFARITAARINCRSPAAWSTANGATMNPAARSRQR